MDTSAFITYLQSQSTYSDQVAHIEHIQPREALTADLDQPLSPALQARLDKKWITSLYTHQAEAVNLAHQGKNVMVATSSASGKSLCYNLSVLDTLLNTLDGRAIYLFPTKALSQDQY